MKSATALRFEGEITEDGHLQVELPPDLSRGPVLVTLEPLPQDTAVLTDMDLRGAGLTAEEIVSSPEIGAWAGEPEIPTGADYVERIRSSPRYSW